MSTIRATLIVALLLSNAKNATRAAEPPEKPQTAAPPSAKPNFDKVGPQVGEQLPNLRLMMFHRHLTWSALLLVPSK